MKKERKVENKQLPYVRWKSIRIKMIGCELVFVQQNSDRGWINRLSAFCQERSTYLIEIHILLQSNPILDEIFLLDYWTFLFIFYEHSDAFVRGTS